MRDHNPLPVVLPTMFVAILVGLSFSLLGGQDSINTDTMLPLGAIVGGIFLLLTMVDIRIGLALFTLAVGLSPEVTVGGVSNIRFEDFIVPVLFLSWIARTLARRETLVSSPVHAPYLWLVGFSILSTLFVSITGTVQGTRAFLVLGKMIEYYLIFLIFLNNLRRREEVEAYVWIVLISATLSAGYSALYARQFDPIPAYRVAGPYGETANIFGGYVLMNLSVAIGLYYHAETARARFWLGLVILFLFYICMFTHSRTTFAAVFGGILLFGLLKRRRSLILCGLLLVLFLLTAPDAVIERAATILTIGPESGPPAWQARVQSWHEYGAQAMENPILGRGLGFVALGDVDNEYVRVFVDTGLLGLGAFIWFLAAAFRAANRSYHQLQEPGTISGFVAGYLLCLFGVAIHAFGATTMTAIRTMETFMILTALFSSISAHYPAWMKEREKALPPEQFLIALPPPPGAPEASRQP